MIGRGFWWCWRCHDYVGAWFYRIRPGHSEIYEAWCRRCTEAQR